MLKQIINQESSSDAQKKETAPAAPSGGKPTPPASSKPAPSGPTSNKMGSSKNILSSDVEIKGKLQFTSDLIIDGHIEGEVSSQGDLTVGENAQIDGDIKTRSVTVFGKVKGNITVSDRCELKQNAELIGDVAAGKLAIEEGASFVGSSAVGAAASRAKSAPAASPSSTSSSDGGEKKTSEG